MTDTNPEIEPRSRLHPNDKLGLAGALILPAILAFLWLGGHGPFDQQACRTVEVRRALHLDLESTPDGVRLAGAVANAEDRAAILAAAESAFGNSDVIDQLTIDAAVPPLGWSGNANGLLTQLKAIEHPARFSIDSGAIALYGTVASAEARDAAERQTGPLLGPETKVTNNLAVRPPPPPPPPVVVERPPPPPAPPPPEPEPAPANGLVKRTLPNGSVIEIAPDGLETGMLAFIEDASRAIDKNLWFEFDRLYFDFDSANLTEASSAQINALTEILKAYPNTAIKVGGYTDSTGDAAYNMQLSGARAERVAKELIAKGITPDRLEFEGYGMAHPQADNATVEGRAKNRRTAVSVRRK